MSINHIICQCLASLKNVVPTLRLKAGAYPSSKSVASTSVYLAHAPVPKGRAKSSPPRAARCALSRGEAAKWWVNEKDSLPYLRRRSAQPKAEHPGKMRGFPPPDAVHIFRALRLCLRAGLRQRGGISFCCLRFPGICESISIQVSLFFAVNEMSQRKGGARNHGSGDSGDSGRSGIWSRR